MATDLVVIERELTSRLPVFAQVLPPSVSPQRLMRTVIMSCERLPKLLECTPQSVLNAATTAAVLGLECDGVTGQGYIIPYWDNSKRALIAQFQVGYKGYNTMGARAGYTITGSVVREADEFDYKLGTKGFVDHKPLLVDAATRRIVSVWAMAEAFGRPPIIVVMGIDEVLAVKEKSPGAKRPDSPWNDHAGPGFAAMVEKTAKRRLARSMPLSVMQQAAALEGFTNDMGKAAHLELDGTLKVVGEASAAPGPASDGTLAPPQPDDLLSPVGQKPKQVFPAFSKVRDWIVYSRTYLQNSGATDKAAWREHFAEHIAKHLKNRDALVREAVEELDKASKPEGTT